MLKSGYKLIFVILFIITLFTCIDPYSPALRGYESLMVIEGLITNANSSYTVNLSGTFQDLNSFPLKVDDATVFITDDTGNTFYLINSGNGVYKTDSTQFRGIVGRTYVLHVLTHEEEEFISDPCLLQPVPEIDSIYYAKDQKLVNNGTENQEGISIYLDSKNTDSTKFYRWSFEETWEFKVPNPVRFNYLYLKNIPVNERFVQVDHLKEYCWKNRRSDEILISTGQSGPILRLPVYFIASAKSDRLMHKYSILVNQYSISEEEYNYWNNLKQINEIGGDIFSKQPYSVVSNIHSIKNPDEKVLGYFQVSAKAEKRKTILFDEIAGMGLPFYYYTCETLEKEPHDFDTPYSPPKTWDDVYWYMCIVSNYTFTEPKYFLDTDSLMKMVFTKDKKCTDCELSGTSAKPDFWNDPK